MMFQFHSNSLIGVLIDWLFGYVHKMTNSINILQLPLVFHSEKRKRKIIGSQPISCLYL